jgi:SAM-dependent methyltransferase
MGLKYVFNTDLDDPQTTVKHRDIILAKSFLKRIYVQWYQNFVDEVKKNPSGKYIEIGSGGGFLKDLIPNVITSDIMKLPHVDMEFSAEKMPFKDNELDGIFMVNVLHHIPHPHMFFKEAERTLKPGGKIIMVEPVNTPVSRFIYKHFHHEPFLPDGGWEIASTGPLSGANGAIPYIYMIRDRKKFEKEFPLLRIEKIQKHTALLYTVSGGVSRKNLVPEWSFGFWKAAEKFPGMPWFSGMLGTYVVQKQV